MKSTFPRFKSLAIADDAREDLVVIRRFAQVDVFSTEPGRGNPVAVVVDGDGVTEEEMAAFARWTNLSETTFVLPPTTPEADYRLRIFTPGRELPFAGHPTLGSAHAWLAAGGRPRAGHIAQECGVGVVPIRRSGARLAFAAPPLTTSGPVAPEVVAQVCAALSVDVAEVRDAQWVVNGPRWMAIRLTSATRVRQVRPDFAALGDHEVGLLGPHPGGLPGEPEVAYEVRAFAPGAGIDEDPVTGSLHAGIATWLRSAGEVPATYVAAQGTALGRRGRVHVEDDGQRIWIGGEATTVIEGTVSL